MSAEARARLEQALAPELVAALERLVDERVAAAVAELEVASYGGRRWLTLSEAGERLGCSPDAVRMRVKRGRLEARRQGSRVYVSAASVDTLGQGGVG
jgi:excisionase family DNA binding protein